MKLQKKLLLIASGSFHSFGTDVRSEFLKCLNPRELTIYLGFLQFVGWADLSFCPLFCGGVKYIQVFEPH